MRLTLDRLATEAYYRLMQVGSALHLPAVVVRRRVGAGQLVHYIAAPLDGVVAAIVPLQLTSRISEDILELATGERIIVTERRIDGLPTGVTGVLRPGRRGAVWQSHALLSAWASRNLGDDWSVVAAEASASWSDQLRFKAAAPGSPEGLRPAQIGALHSLGAHWSLSRVPATIVMPTGTGKTETLIASHLGFIAPGRTLVVVPSKVLRNQTARKLATLGLLRTLGIVPNTARNPVVGIIEHRPTSIEEINAFAECNVLVSTMPALAHGVLPDVLNALAESVELLVVDEAHHIAARTWSEFRARFKTARIVQLTATPFREDGELVDGTVTYTYPLSTAQSDGYFKPITFKAVYEVDPEDGDLAIARTAIQQLRDDLAAGFDHIVMARCNTIDRAEALRDIYRDIAADFSPVVVHSESRDQAATLEALAARRHRVVIAVDMLGEGFDLPELKIAALHDTHKSLAVLLQFTGRFTRVAGPTVGNATVVANIAQPAVSAALERLYSEDADWNKLLSEYSSQAVQDHYALTEFLRASEPLDDIDPAEQAAEISNHLLRPKFSTAVFRATTFTPRRFHEGVPKTQTVHRVWLHRASSTLYCVTCSEPRLQWSRSRDLTDREWALYVLHFDENQQLLFVHSSDKSSMHDELARAVSPDASLVSGDAVFRSLGRITRLAFQNIGLKKHGRRNLRYALYTGADVAQALTESERQGSEKSNLFGDGWENGAPVTIGCSYKGRIWARDQGTIPEFVKWVGPVGAKMVDASIDTRSVLANVLIPEEVDQLPDSPVLSLDWPIELLHQTEDRVVLSAGAVSVPISLVSIDDAEAVDATSLRFKVKTEEQEHAFRLTVGGQQGFRVEQVSGDELSIRAGKIVGSLAEYLSDYPPLVKFVDLSELDGNLIVRPQDAAPPTFPQDQIDVWDWADVDIRQESMWRGTEQRPTSIQGHVAQRYETDGRFEVVFDDDAAGEAADLVCLREEDDHIRLALVHCKFSGGADAGERVKDVVEVCSQAVRSAKWKWRFKELGKHLVRRQKSLAKAHRPSRFLQGGVKELNRIMAASRFKPIRAEIVIVQPGLSAASITPDQAAVLAAANSFLVQTIDTRLEVVCSGS